MKVLADMVYVRDVLAHRNFSPFAFVLSCFLRDLGTTVPESFRGLRKFFRERALGFGFRSFFPPRRQACPERRRRGAKFGPSPEDGFGPQGG
jgi:hypothetical protein